MKLAAVIFLLFNSFLAQAQPVTQRLQAAWKTFENDVQLRHAISSLYVIDAKTGEVVFDKNAQIGLAPASTQKIITSVTAFELLGKDFRFQTKLGYQGTISRRRLNGRIFILPSGDPTFGSWRYANTGTSAITDKFINAVKKLEVDTVSYLAYVDDSRFEVNNIPDRWIWQDLGNYYGAAPFPLNWRENQYTVYLKSGKKVGDEVNITGTEPGLYNSAEMIPALQSGKKGSGDNAYIYLPIGSSPAYITGTIPVEENRFGISGAFVNPVTEFQSTLTDGLRQKGVFAKFSLENMFNTGQEFPAITEKNSTIIYTHYSPALDSIIYWFNKKSINLYGEALVKAVALEKQGFASTDSGVALIKRFWKTKGLDEDELNMYDGSGLSPMNRVTTHAQVEILKFAKTRPWFPYFLNSLPLYNGITMKSGTIGDVKGFCGYHKAKDGREYIFSLLVNNYSGATSGLVGKMYKLLDELK
ncbi:MAG: D-alanyl-D-alanine carboxypeptidase/D-alanyl-D-alanine-endopeptidase [Chitinophagaceae bacterium]|nr:D-alanyl-D-alanine carboxypeptidase/D-alanyl-D-alanine-endopeptidase [Chitinophagaceae bacterium]